MSVTQKEAIQSWCPTINSYCKGKLCMAWRWDKNRPTRGFYSESNAVVKNGVLFEKDEPETRPSYVPEDWEWGYYFDWDDTTNGYEWGWHEPVQSYEDRRCGHCGLVAGVK